MVIPVRQQMMCIVAPAWPGDADLPNGVSKSLNELFTDVGVVHFASIVLLPAISGEQDKPSLMLELVIEEGLSPDDLLYRLAFHPSGAMWSLFGVYWSNTLSPASTRNQELLKRLIEWRYIADGSFVGARDRSVRQISMEWHLLEQTRLKARELRPIYGEDRARFAQALARWAFEDPNLEWAVEPAPRSFWRGKGAGIGAKLAVVVSILGLWFAFLWVVRALAGLLTRADAWLFDRPDTIVQSLLHAVSDASKWLLGASWRLLLAVALVVFVGWLLLGLLPALLKPWKNWLESLQRELDRPTETWSSWSTYWSVWIVGAPLLLATIWSIGVYTVMPEYLYRCTIGLLTAGPLGWKHIGVVAVVVAAVIGVGAFFSQLRTLLPAVGEQFFHPHEDDVDRAQQVHPSIEACEAQLVHGTAHMVSLTDMRSPSWWSVRWSRFFLRLVTLLGYVFFTEGRLGEAPGIHFGHWHIIDGGRRYLFCSNYDGNFGGYLDDFINGASVGTTLFWRWTKLKPRRPAAAGQPGLSEPRAFPPTRFLIFRGVKCELRFKSYARESMLPHLYRFEAYNLTVDQIMRATALRDALFGERNEVNDDQIMRAIEL